MVCIKEGEIVWPTLTEGLILSISLWWMGCCVSDQGSIVECITHFYRQLYSKNEVHRPVLDDVEFGRISEEDAS